MANEVIFIIFLEYKRLRVKKTMQKRRSKTKAFGSLQKEDKITPIIEEGKDQHTSCTAHHGEPLLCPCLGTTCSFFG